MSLNQREGHTRGHAHNEDVPLFAIAEAVIDRLAHAKARDVISGKQAEMEIDYKKGVSKRDGA